jgi:hypothetical protein
VGSPGPRLRWFNPARGGCVFVSPCCARLSGAGLVLPRFSSGRGIIGLALLRALRWLCASFVWICVGFSTVLVSMLHFLCPAPLCIMK